MACPDYWKFPDSGDGRQALRPDAGEMGIDLSEAKLAVVGAKEHASTYAMIMAPLVEGGSGVCATWL